jgi:ABC-2 type transport system permease protein
MSQSFDRRRLVALFAKETRQIVRDPSTLLIAFALPLILLFLFGYGVSLDTARTRIGVALLDSSELALSLAGAYQGSAWFEVDTGRSLAELKEGLVAGKLRGIVVIPGDFGQRVAAGTRADIQVITDGSLPNTANFVAAYAEGIRASWTQARGLDHGRVATPPITANTRFWFNPGLQSRFALIPGSITIVMTMIGTLLTALVVAREWERGTLEALMATPVDMAEFLLAKIVPYFVLGISSMGLCTGLAIFLFDVPFRGSVIALLAIGSAFLLPALGQGLLISAVTKNQFVASQVALLTAFLPAMLLSGFLFEIGSMPRPIQLVTYLVPARYLIPPLTTVFVVGDLWPLFLRNILALLAFGILFLFLAFRATHRRIG